MISRVIVLTMLFFLIVATAFVFLTKDKQEPVAPIIQPAVVATPVDIKTYDLINQICSVAPHEATHLSAMIDDASEEELVPREIILAVISTESKCEWVMGDNGKSIGYGQIQTKFWSNGEYDPENPIDNVYLTAQILRKNYDKTGSWKTAIEAYNIGITRLRKNIARESGRQYVAKVSKRLNIMEQYKKDHAVTVASR